MFNPSYFNPAWTGMENQAFVAAHHRTQWAGYDASFDPEGAPSTQLLTLGVPIKSNILSGFGLSISNDIIGPIITNQIRIAFSAKRETRIGDFYIGLMPSVNLINSNTNGYRFSEDGDDIIQFLINNGLSEVLPNLHAGLLLESHGGLYTGISIENILEPGYDVGSGNNNVTKRNVNLLMGKNLHVSRELLLKPTILIRSDLNSYSLDVSGIIDFRKKMWGGMAFRRAESLSLLLGYSFFEDLRLKAGYSFDYIINEQDAKEPTSHEVFVRYNLPDLVFGGRKAIKTPRFVF